MLSGPTSKAETNQLADQLERTFRGGAWHGPAVAEALDGVTAAAASLRPVAGGHTIWQIVHHVGVWIDVARRRIEGEALEDVPESEDWPSRLGPSAPEWEAEVEALEEAHRRLFATVKGLDDSRLGDPVGGSDPTVRGMLFGVLQHNAYHAGQIMVLRKAGEVAGGAG